MQENVFSQKRKRITGAKPSLELKSGKLIWTKQQFWLYCKITTILSQSKLKHKIYKKLWSREVWKNTSLMWCSSPFWFWDHSFWEHPGAALRLLWTAHACMVPRRCQVCLDVPAEGLHTPSISHQLCFPPRKRKSAKGWYKKFSMCFCCEIWA